MTTIKLRKLNRKEWKDQSGNIIPADRVRDDEKIREWVVDQVIKEVRKAQEVTLNAKKRISELVETYLAEVAKKGELENWKGSANIASFDGNFMVKRSKDDRISFNENLQIAKQHIDLAIKSWSKDSDPNLAILIQEVFNVDKTGTVNKNRIMGLFRYDFKDEHWVTAMEYLKKSIQIVNSKEYYNFFEKDESGELKPVIVNFTQL